MKVLIISHEFPPQVGGAGVVAKEYAEGLSRFGDDVTVLTKKRPKLNSTGNGYSINRVKNIPILWFLGYYKAEKFDNYDVIILNDMHAVFLGGLFLRKKSLAKTIVFLHGSEPEKIFFNSSLKRRLVRFKYFYTRALKYSKRILAVSEFMKRKFLNVEELKIFEKKVVVNYSFINKDTFYPDKKRPPHLFINLDTKAIKLLTVSRMVKGKGLFEMLAAFRQLVDSSPSRSYKWLVIGDGEGRSDFERAVLKYGLSNEVICIGAVSRSELRLYYSHSDIFWLVSNYKESFGLVYLEAQACGCPVIAKAGSGVSEAIIDKKTGFLIKEPKDMLEIMISESYKNIESIDSINFASRFTEEISVIGLRRNF